MKTNEYIEKLWIQQHNGHTKGVDCRIPRRLSNGQGRLFSTWQIVACSICVTYAATSILRRKQNMSFLLYKWGRDGEEYPVPTDHTKGHTMLIFLKYLVVIRNVCWYFVYLNIALYHILLTLLVPFKLAF